MQMTTHYVASADTEFPGWLIEIPNPPRGIFVRGPLISAGTLALAIVGTRRATPTGKALAHDFAFALASRGIAVVSGLAFGVDAAAHLGALDAKGTTIAVLPCGLDRIYPRSNERLAEHIIQNGGALISEYAPGTEALPFRFLQRNRIVSGLARGTIIIEAPERSGALVTARLAAEQGRDCFVVPGPVGNPNFIGSHQLIRKGAELVTRPEEILAAYGFAETDLSTGKIAEKRGDFSEDERKIFAYLALLKTGAEIDKIITAVNVQPQAANSAVSFLLMKGLVKETANGYMLS
jgi:DNA processing protein